jgi:2-C-methyl-D-erythritol 4-phosphate cytidylyltransferase
MAPVWSIVVAGGSGRRFGRLKQFSELAGRPVLEWAVQACRPCSAGVVLVVPATDAASGAAEAPDPHGADAVVSGGATRADSVRCGLAAVPSEAAIIVVHDAARPLASPALFEAVIAAVTEGGADGAVPGVPLRDTIKVVDESGRVTDTLDRDRLVAVQTPQAFNAAALRRAHAEAAPDAATPAAAMPAAATDDAMLVEALGGTVLVVPGEPGNLKITDPDDLLAAERLVAARRR